MPRSKKRSWAAALEAGNLLMTVVVASHFCHIRSGRCLSAILGGQGPEAVKLDACDQSSVLQKVSFRTTFGGKYSGIRAFPVDTSTEEASAKFSPQKLLEVKSSKRSIVGDHQIMSRNSAPSVLSFLVPLKIC